ncbi:MAG: phenylacetate-CoA oxygenase subunit PaaC [Proteobacteria bacterium]|nr:phenylacetate-CoA oxygenase subunit PaaC [Pseudomonadota bacterium]
MSRDEAVIAYVLRLADNALILAQRMIELVTAKPELEEELANANFALDFIGQARMLYSYAAELEGAGRSEDDFAFMRDGNEFRNLLLIEQPNGHFGDSIVRQYLFEAFYVHQLDALTRCKDQRIAEIAARAIKEVRYHLRHISHWLIRLGDGTDESHQRVQASLDELWRFTGEMFVSDEVDVAIRDNLAGPDLEAIAALWKRDVEDVIAEATLQLPEDQWMARGGKQGQHSEHFGFLIAEMQFLQRSYAGASW